MNDSVVFARDDVGADVAALVTAFLALRHGLLLATPPAQMCEQVAEEVLAGPAARLLPALALAALLAALAARVAAAVVALLTDVVQRLAGLAGPDRQAQHQPRPAHQHQAVHLTQQL